MDPSDSEHEPLMSLNFVAYVRQVREARPADLTAARELARQAFPAVGTPQEREALIEAGARNALRRRRIRGSGVIQRALQALGLRSPRSWCDPPTHAGQISPPAAEDHLVYARLLIVQARAMLDRILHDLPGLQTDAMFDGQVYRECRVWLSIDPLAGQMRVSVNVGDSALGYLEDSIVEQLTQAGVKHLPVLGKSVAVRGALVCEGSQPLQLALWIPAHE